jgi:phosphodiesterase/alkaline phosphatase D-like protein
VERLTASSAVPNLRAGFLRCAVAGLLALIVLALLAVPGLASAAYIHPSENWGFGKDGTSKTDFQEEIFSGEQYGEIEQIHINQATRQLLAIWQPGFESKRMSIFEIGGPESMTPRGGNFPQPISGFCCWRVAMDESNTATAGRIYISSLFAEEGPTIYTPDGEPVSGINFAPESGFKGGVAVDQEGNIFLVNTTKKQIEEFEPVGGPPFRIFTLPTEAAANEPGALVYDKLNGDLFVSAGEYVYRLTKEANYEDPTPTKYHDIGQAELALDPAAGILYLTDYPEYPTNYKQGWRAYDIETGSLLETRLGGGSEGAVKGIAVDESTHTVYTSNDDNSVERVEEWRPVVVPDVATDKPTGNATLNGTVGLAGAGNVTECFFEYGPGLNNYTSTKPCSPAAPITEAKSVSAELTGLTDETTYHYRLVAANANGKSVGGDMTLTPHRVVALMTGPAEEVKRTSAKLTASYDGTGEATKYWFEWGVKPSALTSSSSEEEEGATNGATQISDVAEGLNPDTVYYYRVVAKNAQGESKGDILRFRTAPAVQSLETNPATNVKPRSAELNASYVGDGTHTTYFFEWGTHRTYGNSTPVEDAGSPTGPQNLTPASVTNLELETVYHYRVVATNTSGTTAGPDRSFKTTPAVGGIQLNATEVESHTAMLTGQYVGDGQETSYYYEWGTNTAYLSGKSQTFNTGGPTGTTQLESLPISNLLGGTTYHFHIVATNATGTTKSPDTTFFTPTNVRGLATLAATEITQDTITLNAEFNGNGQDTHYYFEYGPTTGYGNKAPLPPGTDAGSPTGVTHIATVIDEFNAYSTYHFRVVASNDEGSTNGNDLTFQTQPARVPGIQGTRASNLAPTAATLEAAINPEHWSTIYVFEYGLTTAYGQQTEISDPIGEDHSFHPVSNAIAGLEPGTAYHFRVVATNFTGTTHGPDQTFATPGPPKIDLAAASDVAPSSAHLAALVDPKSSATTVRFDYGATTAYGASSAPIDVGAGNGDRQAAADIAGLASDTTYHYRVVAANAYGIVESRDQTFTTGQSALPRGEGSEVKCKKGFVKRKGKCVKKKHHRKHRRRNSSHRNG